MSVRLAATFDAHPIHVLEVRGRPAFIPCELAIAAGYQEEGRRFLDQIFHDWAAGLDEDDDLAQLTPAELDGVRRDLPEMSDTKLGVVLFATGAERCLRRARARRAQALLEFVQTTLLPRFDELTEEPEPETAPSGYGSTALAAVIRGDTKRAPTTALQDALAKLKGLGGQIRKVEGRSVGYRALVELAEALREDHVVTHEEWGALRVEAVEHLLGRGLRTRLGLADLLAEAPAAS